MPKSRLDHVIRNMGTGILGKLSTQLMTFVSRSVFIHVLGMEYLGISGLFTNVLSVLALADLGFNSAIIFSMYEPLSKNDTVKLAALTTYYKKIFRIIAAAVLVMGLALIPFLPYIINLQRDVPNLTLYYVLYLLNTVFSFLFVYKSSIAIANQVEYKLNIYTIIMAFATCAAQVTGLLLFRSYLLFLVLQILSTLITNMLRAKKSERLFPYINQHGELAKHEKRQIVKNSRSMFLIYVAQVSLNQTDNILISALISTTLVGFYSNYNMIISSIKQVSAILKHSLSSSIGNMNVSESKEKQYQIFRTTDFAFFWFTAFCAISFWILAPDFFGLWGLLVGRQLSLDNMTVFAVVLNFYVMGVIEPTAIFRNTTGTFNQTYKASVAATGLNIVFSIVLGKLYGITGILMATSLACLVTTQWFNPYVLYARYFEISVKPYWTAHVKYLGAALLSGGFLQLITFFIPFSYILNLIIKGILCLIVPNGLFWLFFRKTEAFRQLWTIMSGKLAGLHRQRNQR